MIKALITILIITGSLFAADGQSVYETNCASCHQTQVMMSSMREKMKDASDEEIQVMRKKMQQKMQNSSMKAPPMQMISMRLKNMIGSKKEFIAFVKDYIKNPSQEKGYCMPMAYQRFGVMPPIGKDMKEEDIDAVANWIYNNFEGSWGKYMGSNPSCGMGAANSDSKNSMKCGAGKCGSR